MNGHLARCLATRRWASAHGNKSAESRSVQLLVTHTSAHAQTTDGAGRPVEAQPARPSQRATADAVIIRLLTGRAPSLGHTYTDSTG